MEKKRMNEELLFQEKQEGGKQERKTPGQDENRVQEERWAMERPDYKTKIREIVRSNASPRIMKEKLEDYHENDIAQALTELTLGERRKIYRVLDVPMLSDVFEYSQIQEVSSYLEEMDLKKAAAILSGMEADAAGEVLGEMEKTRKELLIELMDEGARKDIALLASFDKEEIGSRMTTNYIEIRENLSVKEAMSTLIRQAAKNDNISTLFVVDEERVFYGAVDLKELIIARQDTPLEDLIRTSYPYVYGKETIDDCIEKLKDYSEDSLPVLDNENHLLGVITSQSIIQVVDDTLGEDYAMLAGLTAEEDLQEPIKESVKKRLPWLLVLLGLGLVVSTVVGAFEQVVSQLTLIMCFQSLILDMAGNVGTQSLAVTIRVLTDGALTFQQKIRLVGKEIRIGGFNGLLLGVISFLCIGGYIMVVKGKGIGFAFAVSGCIGMSLLVAMVISSAFGTLIPLFFQKIHIDPAVASGPLITTVNDLVAVVVYYGLSWLLLLQVLHF